MTRKYLWIKIPIGVLIIVSGLLNAKYDPSTTGYVVLIAWVTVGSLIIIGLGNLLRLFGKRAYIIEE